jgi:hypothetical protein
MRPQHAARPRPSAAQNNSLADIDSADVKDGAYAIRDGLLAIRRGSVFETAKVPGSVAFRIRGMLAVRDAIRVVFRTQLDDAPAERITEARKLLNDIYDSFIFRYGPLSSRENIKAFAGDPDQPLFSRLKTTIPRRNAPPRPPSSSAGRWSAINRSPMSRRRPRRSPSR